MKRFSHFIDFTAEDFAADESFQSYVSCRDEQAIAFWSAFAASHPEKVPEMQAAAKLLTTLTFKASKVKRQVKQSELNRLLTSIAMEGVRSQRQQKGKRFTFSALFSGQYSGKPVRRMAASFAAILAVISLAFFFSDSLFKEKSIELTTGFGETSTYILPDSSIVILNANSRLIHHRGWDQSTAREVWLEGEAFFDVKHTSSHARFIVHVPGMEVEVLGTKFNVFNRKDKANVVLNSGKVEVRIVSKKDRTSIVMAPDEALELSRKDLSVRKRSVKAEVLTSWRNQILIFEETPLSRIAEMIEYHYGVNVIFQPDVDTSQKLQGTVPLESLDVLLKVLAKSSNLPIKQNGREIIIGRPNH